MKISFDFDSTLSRKSIQKVAKELIARGDEIHIVTSRYSDTKMYADYRLKMNQNNDLFRVTDHLGIKRENIHFMNMKSKHLFFDNNLDFIVHLDDDKIELASMEFYSKPVIPIYCDPGQEWQIPFRKITNLPEVQGNVD